MQIKKPSGNSTRGPFKKLLGLLGGGAASVELLEAAGSVEHLLVAGKEWVALGADFHLELFAGGAHGKGASACADNLGLREVGRMGLLLHI